MPIVASLGEIRGGCPRRVRTGAARPSATGGRAAGGGTAEGGAARAGAIDSGTAVHGGDVSEGDAGADMLILSGLLIALAAVLAGVGLVGASAFVYASLVLTFVAAALLPVGAVRRVRR